MSCPGVLGSREPLEWLLLFAPLCSVHHLLWLCSPCSSRLSARAMRAQGCWSHVSAWQRAGPLPL